MRDQLHTPTVVTPKKYIPVPNHQEDGWIPEPVFTFGELIYFPSQLRIEIRFLEIPNLSLITTNLMLTIQLCSYDYVNTRVSVRHNPLLQTVYPLVFRYRRVNKVKLQIT